MIWSITSKSHPLFYVQCETVKKVRRLLETLPEDFSDFIIKVISE